MTAITARKNKNLGYDNKEQIPIRKDSLSVVKELCWSMKIEINGEKKAFDIPD